MALANQNTSFDSGKQLSVMRNGVIHSRKTQDTSIKHIWWHLWWQIAICQSNTSGDIYGGRLLSVNQNTSGSIYGSRLLSVNQNTDNITSRNKLYQQIQ